MNALEQIIISSFAVLILSSLTISMVFLVDGIKRTFKRINTQKKMNHGKTR